MDMNQMMKQAQELQKKMKNVQDDLASAEVEGKAAGGLVTVKVTGKGEAKGINIDPKLMDAEEKEMLEDLIVAAFNNARQNADIYLNEQQNYIGL